MQTYLSNHYGIFTQAYVYDISIRILIVYTKLIRTSQMYKWLFHFLALVEHLFNNKIFFVLVFVKYDTFFVVSLLDIFVGFL